MAENIINETYTAEDELPSNVPLLARIIGCLVASAVAVIPSVTAAYCANQIGNFFTNLTQEQLIEEPLTVSRAIVTFSAMNEPLVIALCLAAFLAIGFAVFIAISPKRRLMSVGMPLSLGTPLLGCAAALFLWRAEAITLNVLAGEYSATEIGPAALNANMLILATYIVAVLALSASLMCSVISLLRSPLSRGEPLSAMRATIWIMGGIFLLVCAGAFFFRISMRAVMG